MNRRGFLARLFAAPIVALALLKAPIQPEPETEGVFRYEETELDVDEMRRYIEPAVKAMVDAHDRRLMEMLYR